MFGTKPAELRRVRRQSHALSVATIVFGLTVGAAASSAQVAVGEIKARIWELQLGTPVSELPPQYLDPHCGTNGGPPGARLASWSEYALCPAEPETGLHEIWFTEDDEAEYVARAYRTQLFEPGPFAANVLAGHKVIYSVLVDDAGVIQGYRVFSDPREAETFRYRAHRAADALLGFYGYSNFTCTDLPAAEGETEVEGLFVKRDCVAMADGRYVMVAARHLRKPGQFAIDPATNQPTTNYFESSFRLEVFATAYAPVQR
jgi:hypothetical protein